MKKKEADVAKSKKTAKKVKSTKSMKTVKKTKTATQTKKAKPSPKVVAKKAVAKKAVVKKAVAKKIAVKKAAPQKNKKTTTQTKQPTAAQKTTQVLAKTKFNSQDLVPLDDRIVVQVIQNEKMTAGGLYIPETADVSGNFKGVVKSVGRGHMNKKGKVKPMDVKAGDEIVFSEFAGSPITVGAEEFLILRESDVLGVITK